MPRPLGGHQGIEQRVRRGQLAAQPLDVGRCVDLEGLEQEAEPAHDRTDAETKVWLSSVLAPAMVLLARLSVMAPRFKP